MKEIQRIIQMKGLQSEVVLLQVADVVRGAFSKEALRLMMRDLEEDDMVEEKGHGMKGRCFMVIVFVIDEGSSPHHVYIREGTWVKPPILKEGTLWDEGPIPHVYVILEKRHG